MNQFEAIILGAVQGATEFLPISSSGHLKLGATLLGIQEPTLLFDITLHVGSLIAVCLVYYKTVLELITGALRGTSRLLTGQGLQSALEPEGARLAALIVLATLPTGVIGVLLKDFLEGPLITPAVVGGALIVNGVILLMSRRLERSPDPAQRANGDGDAAQDGDAASGRLSDRLKLWRVGMAGAILIGVAQGMAVMPGLSRAGLTITTALMMGVEREQAARFSFLLSIPAILGAMVLKFDPALFSGADPARLVRFGLGALTACLVGAVCLVLLIALLRRARFHHFAWYCFAVGAAALLWPLWGG